MSQAERFEQHHAGGLPRGDELNKILVDKDGKVPSNNALNNHAREAKGWGFIERVGPRGR
jgi:hypothetical protein